MKGREFCFFFHIYHLSELSSMKHFIEKYSIPAKNIYDWNRHIMQLNKNWVWFPKVFKKHIHSLGDLEHSARMVIPQLTAVNRHVSTGFTPLLAVKHLFCFYFLTKKINNFLNILCLHNGKFWETEHVQLLENQICMFMI